MDNLDTVEMVRVTLSLHVNLHVQCIHSLSMMLVGNLVSADVLE